MAAASANTDTDRTKFILAHLLPLKYLTTKDSALINQTATKLKKPWCKKQNPIPEKEPKKQADPIEQAAPQKTDITDLSEPESPSPMTIKAPAVEMVPPPIEDIATEESVKDD